MEKEIIIGLPQPSLKFYNHTKKCMVDSIWPELSAGLWEDYNIYNALINEDLGMESVNCWLPVFTEYTPILPGFLWNADNNCLDYELYHPQKLNNTNLSTFLSTIEKYLHQFDGKKIGVHLSGGFDSTLLIGLLRFFKIPFFLAGYRVNRFEFRTERYIQDIISHWGEKTILLDLDDYPFYSHLELTPKHQVPDAFIKSNESAKALADVFKKENVDIVFTGQGGDSLFIEDETDGLASYNIGYEFLTPWEQELIYSPRGIQLESPYANKDIVDQISNLRLGQREDPLKLWARNYFKEFIPRELSEYSYFADFYGMDVSGLEAAKPTIKLLFEECYDLTRHKLFSELNTKEFLNENVYALEIKEYIKYGMRISIAAWLHALFRYDKE